MRRRWKGSLSAAGFTAIGALALSSCFAAGTRPFPPASPAPSAPVPESRAEAAPPPPAPVCDAACGADVPSLDLADVVPVLDDARLSDVKTAVDAGDYQKAAKALASALASVKPSGLEALRWQYQLGRLRAQAGDSSGAIEAFDAAAAEPWPLVPYAKFGAALALVRLGRHDEGMARARAVPEGTGVSASAQLLVAEALEAKGDHEGAIPIWREYLEGARRPSGWVNVALKLAQAILDASPDAKRAEEAASLARRVLIEAPTSPQVGRALDLEQHALAIVPESRRFPTLKVKKLGDVSAPLSPAEHVARAAALADAGKADDAEKIVEAVLALPRAKVGDEGACKAHLLYAQLLGKRREKAKSSDEYGVAIERCDKFDDVLVEALYAGGKAAASAGRCDEALVRFGRVESEFRSRRYADDARLRGADCALALGDEAKFSSMLSSLADDYPDGDVVGDGLFKLALHEMLEGRWAAALASLERSLEGRPRDRSYWAAGRAEYFRAKALAKLGQNDAAAQGFAGVVRDYPLSFYMLEAYARLSELDSNAAKQALDDATAREPGGAFQLADLPLFHEDGFARLVELVREGDLDFARRETQALGLGKEDAPADALWAVALLYSRTGSPQLTHALPRARLTDWLGHYPVGRWRTAWELAFPRPWPDLVDREAKRSGIDASLAYAIMREESAFDPDASSPARAYGLMQLIVPTARHVGKKLGLRPDESALKKPEVNVALGCQFLGDLQSRFSSNPTLCIPAYNAGPGAPERWITQRSVDDFDLWVEKIPYEETRKYTKRVMTSYAAYLFLYERDRIGRVLELPRLVSR